MKEGKIHAIITTGISLAAIGLWIADACLAHSAKGYALLSIPAFLAISTIANIFNYVDPDRGLDQSDGKIVFFGHSQINYRKHFKDYSEQDLWAWRLWGYTLSLLSLIFAVLLYFVIMSHAF
jgi:hypothetical protein